MLVVPAPAHPPTPQPEGDAGLTINKLLVTYWAHVQSYYIKDGRPTSEQDNIRQALRFVRPLYGHTPARDFSPLALKAVRQAMIEAGRCRSLINKDVCRVRSMFRWAVEHELMPLAVYQTLMTVAGLRVGRSEAREKPPVGPVPDEVVEQTLPFLTPTVAAMVQIQRLTGMRPGEVVPMRSVDIDRSDPACWVYRPARHKGQHHDRERLIYLGPKAQAILRPFLTLDLTAYLFSPRRSVEQYRAEVRARRKSPLTPSQVARRPKPNPERTHGELYDDGAYRKAIRKACQKAGVPIWFPHQLRHSAASEVRRRYGLEASQAVLGHSELGTTQVYAEVDRTTARRVMTEIG
jgi:integrase